MKQFIPPSDSVMMSFIVCVCQFFTHKVSWILLQKYLKYFERTKICISFAVRLCVTMQNKTHQSTSEK